MDYICTKCNYVGNRKRVKAGSIFISIMLWTALPTFYVFWEFHLAGTQLMEYLLTTLKSTASFAPSDIAINAPGPIYSIWRRVKKTYACPQCNEKVMMQAKGEVAKINMKENDDDLSLENIKKIPFIWEKDVKEYKERHPDYVTEPDDITLDKKTDSNNGSKEEW